MQSKSIQKSILLIATTSLLTLTTVMVIFLSRNEMERVRENTRSLVREQIGLIVNQLDVYKLTNQVSYTLKVTSNLNSVDGVNIFDKSCKLIAKQPVNFNSKWNCKRPLSASMVLYESHKLISDSNGAPKYILVNLKEAPHAWLNTHSIRVILISSILILITLLCLNFFLKQRILIPIKDLIKVIRKPGAIRRDSKEKDSLPTELGEIYDDVLYRDEIIQQKKVELLKQRENEVKNQVYQQVAHDIRSPIMMLRDYHLKLYESGKEPEECLF